jgi:PKD repeat protein
VSQTCIKNKDNPTSHACSGPGTERIIPAADYPLLFRNLTLKAFIFPLLFFTLFVLNLQQGISQDKSDCQAGIVVDLSASPDAVMDLPPDLHPGEECCGMPDYYDCFEVKMILHPEAKAFEIEFIDDIGELYYVVNCSGGSLPVPSNRILRICVDDPLLPISVTFCRPNSLPYNLKVTSLVSGVEIDYAPLPLLCINSAPLTLDHALPTGGQYFIKNETVPSATFNPATYGIGDHNITYKYTDPLDGCTGIATQNITVGALPELTCTPHEVCLNHGPIDLQELQDQLPPGGKFVFNSAEIVTFDPQVAGTGIHTIEYIYTHPDTGCTNSCSFTIKVNALPIANQRTETLCDTEGAGIIHNINLRDYQVRINNQPNHVFEFYTDEELSSLIISPENVSVTASQSFWVKVTNTISGCHNVGKLTFNFQVMVLNHHSVEYCDASTDNSMELHYLNLTIFNKDIYPTGTGRVFKWYTDAELTNAAPFPVPVVKGPTEIFYVEVSHAACTASSTLTVGVKPRPELDCSNLDFTVCQGSPAIVLRDYFSHLPASGSYYLGGTSLRTNFNPTTPGVYYYTYIYSDPTTLCTRTCEFYITVEELPTANNRTPVVCDKDGSGVVHNMDLTSYEGSVSGQPGNLYEYYEDALLTLPVAMPTNLSITHGKRFWVKVSNPSGCSRVATITFSLQTLEVTDKTFSLCDVSGGSNVYYNLNLTTYNSQMYPSATGITYQWFTDAGLSNPITGTVAVTPHNTDYWVRVTRGPCVEVAKATFLVNPLPAVGCPSVELTFCRNDAPLDLTTLSVSPAGGVFSGSGVSGTIFNPATALTGNNPITYTYTHPVSQCFSSCTFTIMVHDVPTINASNQNIDFCHPSGEVTVDLFSYRNEINTQSGVSFSFFKDPALTIPATTSGNYTVQDGDIIYVKVSNIHCFERATLTFTVKDGLNLAPQATTLCDQTLDDQKKVFDINLNGFNNLFYPVAPEVSYDWFTDPTFNTKVLSNIPVINNGDKYYIRATYDQCTEQSDLTFNVLPLPELTCNITVEDLCKNTAPYDLENIAPQPGGYFEGIGVVENFFEPGIAGPGTHVLSYYYTDAFSCTARCDFTITVKVVTPAVCPDTLYFCSAGGARLLNQALPLGGVYEGTGVYSNEGQFYFDTDLTGIGIHPVNYIYSENGCQDTCTVVINVLEFIPFSCDGDQITCENSDIMILNDLCPQPGTFSGNGVAYNSQTEQYEFNPSAAGVGTHLITHVFTNPQSLIEYICLFNITVQAPPVISCNLTNKDFCPEYGPITLTDHFSPTPAGGTFFYNGAPIETFIPTESGVFEIVYSYTDPTTNCENTCSFTITINPQPDAKDIIVDLCHPSGQLVVNLNDFKEFIFSQVGATFAYFSDHLYTNPLVDPTNYTAQEGNIVYVKVTNSFGCAGYATMGFVFTTIELTEQTIELCDQSNNNLLRAYGVDLQDYNSVFYPENPGLTFHWYTHEAMLPQHEVLVAETINNGDMYYLKVALPDCEFSTRAWFNILPLPPVSCQPVNVSMHESELLLIPFATPEGGSFSGNYVSANVFNIQAAGQGYHDITYTYTDGNGCTASCNTQVFVFDPDDFHCPEDLSYCLNEGLIELDMATPSGGIYTGTGISFDGNRYFFNPLVAGAGIHTITFSFALHNYTHVCTFLITVKGLPPLNCPTDIILCRGDGNVTLNDLTYFPGGGIFTGQYITESSGVYTFNTDLAASGTYIIDYTYTHPTTHCTNTCSFTIRVNELPVIQWTGALSFCSNDVLDELLLASPAGGVYSGNWVVDGTSFNFAAAGPGDHPVTYTLTNQFGCSSQSSNFITVFEAPVAQAGQNFHINECTSITLNGSATAESGHYAYMWSPAALLSEPTLPHPITHSLASTTNFRLTVTDSNGCSDTDQMTVSVQNSASITIPDFDPLCANADPIDLAGGNPTGGLFYINDDTNPSTIFDPVTRGPGQHYIYYLLEENDCFKTGEKKITVYPLPEIKWTGQEFCAFSGLQELNLALPAGGDYSGDFVTENYFNTNTSAAGLFDVGYSYTDLRGCTAMKITDVTVHQLPDANAGPEQTIYLGNYTTLSAINNDEGEFAYVWAPAVFIVSPLLQTTFTRELLFSQVFAVTVLDKQTGCSVKDETAVLVEGGDLDFVYAFASKSTLCAGDTITLKTLVSGGKAPYSFYWYTIDPQINFEAPHINPDTSNRDFVVVPEVTQPYYVKVEDSNGGIIFRQITPTVNPLPEINFPLPEPFCYDTSIDITQLSSPKGGAFFISDHEGNQTQPPYSAFPHINTADLGQGTHNLLYKYTDTNGCTSTLGQAIEIIKVTPSFTVSQPDLCKPHEVIIENSSMGATSYQWDFEDNSNNTPEDIANHTFTHIFSNPDEARSYTIHLTAQHPQCPAVTFQTIEVEARPRALFAAPDNGCAPHTLTLVNQSIGDGIQYYFWDFGDGTSSTLKNPVKTFQNATGSDISFPIRLAIASNEYQCQSTYEQSITIYPQTEAGFSVYPRENCSPFNVEITDQSRNAQWIKWDFGDGNDLEYLSTGNTDPINYTYINIENVADTLQLTQTVWLKRNDQNICSHTHAKEIVVFPEPGAVISNGGKSLTEGDVIEGCSPLTVDLSSIQSPNTASRTWDLGDGNVSSSANISHTFLNTTNGPVEYTVSLQTLSPYGCNDNSFVTVRVLPTVKAGFTFTPPQACGEATVDFVNTSTANGSLTYHWSFSNGSQSTEANPTILFQNQDTEEKLFNIEMVATSQGGCSASSTASFRLPPSPKAIISTTPPSAGTLSGCAPFTVGFSALDSLNAQNYSWDFDDGTTGSSLAQTVHTFTRPGTYQVNLWVGTNGLCQDHASVTVEVNSAPQPIFSTDIIAGCSPLTVNFDYPFTPDENTEYLLDLLGNGVFEPVAALPSSHVFTNTGDTPLHQTIRLRSVSPQGCTHEYSKTITIYPQVTAEIQAFDQNNAQVSPAMESCSPLPLRFSAAGSTNAISHHWDFGDGITSTLPDPTHNFQNPARDLTRTFLVRLEVFSQHGCMASQNFDAILKPSPVADFMVDVPEGCSPHAIQIHNLSSNASSYHFDFGNGNTSSDTHPSHIYQSTATNGSQTFDITLEATHVNGCKNTLARQVTIYPELKAGFDISQTVGCNSLVVNFTNTSIAPQEGASWYWNFGNGNISTSKAAPVQNYPGAGVYSDTTYTASLTLQYQGGCSHTFRQEIVVKAAPLARFVMPESQACHPYEFQPENLSQGATLYEWNFGDGSPVVAAVDKTINHVFQNTGNQPMVYNLTLTAIGENGCSSSVTHPLTINPRIEARFELDNPTGCHPFTTTIKNLSQGAHHYLWDFGDGITSSEAIPSHTFTNSSLNDPIERTIRLLTRSDYGCQALDEQTITIYPAPLVNVSLPTVKGCTPFTPSISVISENSTRFLWDFGDGSTSEESNPGYSWINQDTHAKNYLLTLSAFNSFKCKTEVTRTVTVYPEVVAEFSTTDNSLEACSPATLSFINQSTAGQNYDWNFGNGNTSRTANPQQVFLNNTDAPAQYQVGLEATSQYGCKDFIAKEFTINPGVLADFAVSPRIQTYPNTTIELINPNPGMGWSYQWDLGDGQIFENASANFSYTYHWDESDLSSREYTIRMEVSNGYCTEYAERAVIIYSPKPTPLFSSETVGCAPFEVTFSNQSQYAYGYKWDFGDGGISYQANPTYTYQRAGKYELQLIVMGDGGQDTLSRQIEVLEVPRANFEVKSRLMYAPADLLKVINLSESAVSWLWEFGDGGISHDFEPNYRFMEPGLYEISLTVFSDSDPQCYHTKHMENAVRVEEACLVTFPNAFRPSTTGSSDGRYIPGASNFEVFYPVHHGVEEYQLDIFNRWGELIFRSNDPMTGWDGYVRGKLVEMGVYVWKLEVKCTTGKIISTAGDVTVIR